MSGRPTNICPVTGEECNNESSFSITERLGDKSQTTVCCRRCAAGLVQLRNNVALTRTLESHGVKVFSAQDFDTVPRPNTNQRLQSLEEALARAVAAEDYVEAARIRDVIKEIKGTSPPGKV